MQPVLGIFVVVLLVLSVRGDPVPCSDAEWWAVVQYDAHAAFLYRDSDGARDVADALAYFRRVEATNASIVFWPPAWSTALVAASSLQGAASCDAARALLNGSATAVTEPRLLLLLDGLVRYRAFLDSESLACSDPYAYPVYDALTDQLHCACADGKQCATLIDSSSDPSTWSGTFTLAIVVAVFTLLIATGAVVTTAVGLFRAVSALEQVHLNADHTT